MTLEHFLLAQHTPKTAASYQRSIEKFKLSHRNYKTATYQDIVIYLDNLNSNKNRTLSALKKYYDYLIETGQRADHPCKTLVVKRHRPPLQLQDLFSVEELELLLKRESRYRLLENRNKCIISLLIYQGLTPENLVNLRTSDIDFDEGTVYIKAITNLHRRTLPLYAKQMNYFYKYLYQDRDKFSPLAHSNLFIGKLGHSLTVDALNRLLRPLKGLFPGKNLNAQTIRQSVISNWLNKQGKSLEETQKLSGHKWLSSLEKYKIENRQKKKDLLERVHPL